MRRVAAGIGMAVTRIEGPYRTISVHFGAGLRCEAPNRFIRAARRTSFMRSAARLRMRTVACKLLKNACRPFRRSPSSFCMKLCAASSFDVTVPPAVPNPDDGCRATLSLGFAHDNGATRMMERTHFGPLRVQKPLYPEGEAVCHAIVVHPPGGVVGGDRLSIAASAGPRSHAFISTPGAAKWYKANGRVSRQDVAIRVAASAALEWLPQETIFFNAAQVSLNHEVILDEAASYLGCEILCFGRSASGESFNSGCITQRTSIRRGGTLVWLEQGMIVADDPALNGPLGLAGNTVCATLIAAGKNLPASLAHSVREEICALADTGDQSGATQIKSLLVVRYLGQSSESARNIMLRAWQLIRPELLGRAAAVPRIWNT